jgi:cyclopropane fatty-acyl-phospholipid synthase-like methyltransferase
MAIMNGVRPRWTGSFDWMAKPYAALERLLFGGSFQRMRTIFVPALDGAREVLILGEGDGRFAQVLLDRNPTVRIVVVDGSAAMLRQTEARTRGHSTRTRLVHASVVDWLEAQPMLATFDGVVTTFFLDCLTEAEVARLFAAVSPRVRPGARWLWSDFVVPESVWSRLYARLLLGALYLAFRLTTNISARTLVDPSSHFTRSGWVAVNRKTSWSRVLQARVWVKN